MFDKNEIYKLIDNPKVVYLSKYLYKINKTLFIGCCGWWDYNNQSSTIIKKCTHYFDNWIKHFSPEDNLTFIQKVSLSLSGSSSSAYESSACESS